MEKNKYEKYDLKLDVVLVHGKKDDREYYFIALPYGRPNRVYINNAEYEYLLKLIKGE